MLVADEQLRHDILAAVRERSPITLFGVKYVPAYTRTHSYRFRLWLATRIYPKGPA